MELEELRGAWRALETRIDAGHALNERVFRELTVDRARSALRPLWWLLSTQLAIALGAVVLLGSFLADHWHEPRLAVPALLLDIVALMLIVSTAGQLRVLSSIDYARAVVAIQRMLTDLAVRRAREVRWQWLLMLPLWIPCAIVVMQGIFGVDLYRMFGTRWIVVNVGVGIVLTPLIVWWAHRFADGHDGMANGVAQDIAGRRLSEAMRRLDEVGAFSSEV